MKSNSASTTAIKAMMIASQLLLTYFTGNWLHSQYEKEKERLRKDVKEVLVRSSQEVSDSALFNKIVSPLLKVRGTRVFKDSVVTIGPDSYKKVISKSITVTASDSPVDKAKLHKQLAGVFRHHIHLDKDDSVVLNVNGMGNNSDKFIISSDTAEQLLRSVMPIVLRHISQDGTIIGIDSLLRTDTDAIRQRFSETAKKNNWTFKIAWVADSPANISKKGMVIIGNTPMHTNKILVENYTPHLLGKMMPQVLFVLLLLTLTGASFIFAYRSLKQQMRLSAMKNDFISNMSHELKTPIATVKVALEALDNFNMLADPATTRDYIKMAGIEMNRLDMLVNQALNTSMLEAGKIVLQKEKYDVRQLINETLALFKYRVTQHNGTINSVFDGNDFSALVDKTHLQGVLINILDNSLKYSDKTPSIHIDARATTNNITIAVKDNGPGIKQEYIRNVFDKFFRVPAGDTHNIKGYGLGLSYAKQVVELHYGTIDVCNLPAEGCVFTINLPKA